MQDDVVWFCAMGLPPYVVVEGDAACSSEVVATPGAWACGYALGLTHPEYFAAEAFVGCRACSGGNHVGTPWGVLWQAVFCGVYAGV